MSDRLLFKQAKWPLAVILICMIAMVIACEITEGNVRLNLGSSAPPLDDETLESLTLSMSPTIQMQPGATREFRVGVVECCYVFEPVTAGVVWSVSPSQGARINSRTGLLTIDPTTPNGSVFIVSADVENGRRVVSIEVYVYTPEANPLVDIWWREEAQFVCGTGEEIIPEEPIGELVFNADGTFSVTWTPFEIYRDYWGTYNFDAEAGTLELFVEGGNYVPDDIDGNGTFAIDERGRLTLSDMWLGTRFEPIDVAVCGHRFWTLSQP